MAVAMATEQFTALFPAVPGPSRRDGGLGQRLAYGSAVLLFHAYPLPRGGGFSGTLAYTAELVEEGYCPLIFPEGRLRRPGEGPPSFREGPAMLALELSLPVIPVGIEGSGERLPPRARIPRPGGIRVRFGTPVQVSAIDREEEDAGEGDRVARLTSRLERAVRALSGPTASRTSA
jgi:1-acyl-sn-glycerol-3-phosphate acyltransferase